VRAERGVPDRAQPAPASGVDPEIADPEAAASEMAVRALGVRSQKGNAPAFGQLYDRFQPEIVRYLTYRVGNPDTAEDLAQQIFLKA
jgi:RNA polymerase sigma-70 factor (ECF subfamily)